MFEILAKYNVVPLVAPVDTASTAVISPYVSVKNAHGVAFYVQFGAVTSATALDVYDITLEGATAEGGTEAQIDFWYRKSGAVGANTWGAITSASTVAVAASADDNKAFWIEVEPGIISASDYQVVRLKITDNPEMTAGLVGVTAFVEPKYKMTTMTSATASASS